MSERSYSIPIRIEPFFWILAFLIGWLSSDSLLGAALWMVVIFISVLFHEFGHALTAIVFGQNANITLTAFGGVTQRDGPKLSSWKEFLIVFNGPLAGFILYLICVWLLTLPSVQNASFVLYMVTVGTYINLFWTIVNLAPVHPLDGGQLVMVIFRALFGLKGVRIAFIVSCVLSIFIAIGFFLIHAFLAGAIFLMFAFESYRSFQASKYLSQKDDNEELKSKLEEAMVDYEENHLDSAETKLIALRKEASQGIIYLTATYFLAKILERRNQLEEAYDLLEPERSKLEMVQLKTLQRLAFDQGKYKEAVDIGGEIHPEQADSDVAYINALSNAELKNISASIGWFESAVREGLEDPEQALKHPGFDPIRDTPEFKQLIERHSENLEDL